MSSLAPIKQQRRNPRAPSEAGRDAAVRIERDRRAEIRLDLARRRLRAHRPQQGAGALRPSHQADAVARDPGLLLQPLPRGHDVGHPFAAGEDAALPDAALRPQFARAVAVRQQHRLAALQQWLRPVAVAPLHRLGLAGEAAAAVQRDHHRKRAVAVGLVKLRVQRPAARRESRPDAATATAPRRRRTPRPESVRNAAADSRRIVFRVGRCRKDSGPAGSKASMRQKPKIITNRWV